MTNMWTRFPESNIEATIKLGRKGDLFTTAFDMTYGLEKETGLSRGHFDMLPTMYKAGMTNMWTRFPEFNMEAAIELGREGNLFTTTFDLTYGPEKETGLFRGRFEMLPTMYKAGMTNMWTRFPEFNMEAAIELGRKGDLFTSAFDMTYGLEKETGLFRGHFDMLPTMYKAGITNMWTRFPESNMEAAIELGREGELFTTALDMTYGPEKDTGLFRGRFEMLPTMYKA